MNVYDQIIKKSENGKVHMTLIDPATSGFEGSANIAHEAGRAGTDFILLGGSTPVLSHHRNHKEYITQYDC